MGNPYTSVSVSGYNANPPSDDGSQTEANRVKWATIKTKLPDPLKTALEAINTNIGQAFGKVVGGAGVTSTAIAYQVLATDQGKLVRVTGAGGVTVTSPDATNVSSPFIFGLRNDASADIIFDGSGAQTVDGGASITLTPGEGILAYTDGTNWFTIGRRPAAVLGFALINGSIVASVGSSALTIAIKGNDGNDPSPTNPVQVVVRNATAATGSFTTLTLTAATSLVISSGSTMGFSSGVAGRLWIVGFNDAGTFRLGAINCLSGTSIYPLDPWSIASSTAEGGAGGADSAQVFYTGTAVAAKPYQVLGYLTYEAGLVTAGTWNATPTRIQLYGLGVPLPGQTVQVQRNFTGAVATGTTVMPNDDTIPQSGEGDQYQTQSITPSSAANVLEVKANAQFAHSVGGILGYALFQDATANALAAVQCGIPNAGIVNTFWRLEHAFLAATTSATALKMRGGSDTAGTTTFNGAAAARKLGGVLPALLQVSEVMA